MDSSPRSRSPAFSDRRNRGSRRNTSNEPLGTSGGGGPGGRMFSEPRLLIHHDWLRDKNTVVEGGVAAAQQEARDAAQGAFSVLARYGASALAVPSSPLAKWRRSAIRLAAGNVTRRVKEAARLKALQRTPYPLVLARIKLLLDRLATFKEHVATLAAAPTAAAPRSLAGAGAKSRRRMGVGLGAWEEALAASGGAALSAAGGAGGGGVGGGGAGVGGAGGGGVLQGTASGGGAAAVLAAARSGSGGDLESAIRSWDLSKAGGHMPSGPMEVLSRRASRMTRDPSFVPDDDSDEDGSGPGSGGHTTAHGGAVPRAFSRAFTRTGVSTGAAATALVAVNLMSARGAAAAAARDAADADGGAEGGGGRTSPGFGELGEGGELDPSLAQLDEPGGNRMSLDKLLEELSTTMSYVSDFLRKVPEETRMEACFAAKMENYKKDQTVYRIGDPPERFHLILTGVVEIWTHPAGVRREKTLIATLKKGQSFGEMAILNDEPRAEVATPTSNCTFLTFHRADLLSIFGPYFRERLLAAEEFFHSRVSVFQCLPKTATLRAISHMMMSTFPAGKDWEPAGDQQIYFINTGSVVLEALDRRFAAGPATPQVGTPGAAAAGTPASADLAATRGANAAAVSAAAGGAAALDVPDAEGNEVLAAISIVDGRAVGTLGHEDELRRLRRAMIPKKTVATLGPGAHFGGGVRILGEGELQSCIKVTAASEVSVYHMHIDQFFKCASPELVRALRDDTAFKLTYYFGRQGAIGPEVVVGHAEAALAARGALLDEESIAAPARGAGAGGRKKKGGKKGPGHSGQVERVLADLADLEAELDNPTAKPIDLYKNGTPVERYYRNPLLCGTARGNALPHLVAAVYGEGLGPLADKVEALAAKAGRRLDARHPDGGAAARMAVLLAPGGSPPGSGATSPTGFHARASPVQRVLAGAAAASPPHGGTASGGGAPGSPPRGTSRLAPMAAPPGRAATYAGGGGGGWGPVADPRFVGSRPHTSPHAGAAPHAGGGADGGAGPHVGYDDDGFDDDGGEHGPNGRHGALAQRAGALTAAGFIWQRMRDLGGRAPPMVRQCLTYDEIAHMKAETRRTPQPGSPRAGGGGGGGGGGRHRGVSNGGAGPGGGVIGGSGLVAALTAPSGSGPPSPHARVWTPHSEPPAVQLVEGLTSPRSPMAAVIESPTGGGSGSNSGSAGGATQSWTPTSAG